MKLPKLDRAALGGTYESAMRAFAKVVTDRRWAAPLSAMALCFGLFLGVAIGPGVSGSVAGSPPQIVAVAVPGSGEDSEPVAEAEAGGGEELEEALGGEEEESYEEEPFEEEEFIEESAPEEAAESEETPPASEPEAEEEETEAVALKGTVVRVNPAAGSYTLAAPSGELVSVHAPKLPKAGTKLAIEATPLPNNTFAEEVREKAGAATKASFTGVVTYVDPDPLDPAYTVSGRGSSLLVHADPATLATLPALGAYAKVAVAIAKGPPPEPAPAALPSGEPEVPPPPSPPACTPSPALGAADPPAAHLVQTKLEVETTDPATYVDLAGVVTALCPSTGQVLLSADDMRESGADLTLTVPAKIKTAGLKLGQSLLATAEVAEDGTLTLAGLASDEGLKGAEDEKAAQGDLAR